MIVSKDIDAGMADFIATPFDMAEVARLLSTVIPVPSQPRRSGLN
ncbi:MAG: hypothetical protein ACXU8U_08400 [Asticcacaulis sp.]